MRYEDGGLPTEVTHDGVNPNSTFTRIDISLRAECKFDYVVGAYVRSKRADRLIDFGLSNNGTTAACSQGQCGEALITRSRFSNSGPSEAVSDKGPPRERGPLGAPPLTG